MIPDAWRHGEIAVIGLSRTGRAVARFLAGEGYEVYASDLGETEALHEVEAMLSALGVAVEIGSHDLDRIAAASLVVPSPGVPPSAPPLEAAQRAGRTIIAELDLALLCLQGVPSIVVSGTNGKSTTTALIAHLLNGGGVNAVAAGNIGYPLIEVASLSPRPDWVVEDGWLVAQIDPREYEELTLENFDEFDQRRYGNTLLIFYERREQVNDE